MKTVDEINGTELKKCCKMLNDSGLSATKIRFVGVKLEDCLKNFVAVVESLEAEKQAAMPKSVILFYNDLIADEVDVGTDLEQVENEFMEADVEAELAEGGEELIGDEADGETVSLVEEAEIGDGSELVDAPLEVVEEPEPAAKKGRKSKEKPPVEKPDGSVAPSRVKHSKVKMSPSVDTSGRINVLNIVFPESGEKLAINLPLIGDVLNLKVARTEAFDFATKNGATRGQLDHISKALNDAGYYIMQRR